MAVETKTSVVKTAVYTGNTWTSPQGKKIYYHRIRMENNDDGEYGSINQDQTKFIVGATVTYEIETKQQGNFTKTIIRPSRDQQATGHQKENRRELDPKIQLRIAKMVSMECAIDFLLNSDYAKIQKGHDYAISKIFLTWMQGKGLDSENGKICSNAIRMAIRGMVIKGIRFEEPKAYDSVLKKAEEYFNFYTSET